VSVRIADPEWPVQSQMVVPGINHNMLIQDAALVVIVALKSSTCMLVSPQSPVVSITLVKRITYILRIQDIKKNVLALF